jgi:hypothetical protein
MELESCRKQLDKNDQKPYLLEKEKMMTGS